MNYNDETELYRRISRELLRATVAERSAWVWKTIAQSLLAGYAVIILFALLH